MPSKKAEGFLQLKISKRLLKLFLFQGSRRPMQSRNVSKFCMASAWACRHAVKFFLLEQVDMGLAHMQALAIKGMVSRLRPLILA